MAKGQDREIAQIANEEDADVICITDARMDPNRDSHMRIYEKILNKETGKKWRSKLTYRPGFKRGCYMGGSILFTSHNCADVRRLGIIEYGIMDRIDLKWRKTKVGILSTYRPYENDAKGSLRTTASKGTEDFEEYYWDNLDRNTGGKNIIVGGDFNLTAEELEDRTNGMVLKRIGTDPAHYTFKAGIGTEHVGRCIDHIMSNSADCIAEVSQNRSFLSDHMPLVATLMITGIEKKQGERLKQTVIPTIKAGDAGARKRLENKMAKTLGGDLED